jgi:hypothetical protein
MRRNPKCPFQCSKESVIVVVKPDTNLQCDNQRIQFQKKNGLSTRPKQKEQSHVNTDKQKSSSSTDQESESKSSPGWSGAHIQFYQVSEMKKWILLDNGSMVNLFCNPDLAEKIHTVYETLTLSTNGGELHTNKCATVPGYSKVWFDDKAITNIFSFALMEDKYKITYDTSKEKAFIIYLPNNQDQFTQGENGLYYNKPTYNTKNALVVNHSVESMEENMRLYTDRQVQCAKSATQ